MDKFKLVGFIQSIITNLECNKTKIDDFEYVRLHLA